MDNHGFSDGRPCAGTHKPVNGVRNCPARACRITYHALMRFKPAVPPTWTPDARDPQFESERDQISQNIEAILWQGGFTKFVRTRVSAPPQGDHRIWIASATG